MTNRHWPTVHTNYDSVHWYLLASARLDFFSHTSASLKSIYDLLLAFISLFVSLSDECYMSTLNDNVEYTKIDTKLLTGSRKRYDIRTCEELSKYLKADVRSPRGRAPFLTTADVHAPTTFMPFRTPPYINVRRPQIVLIHSEQHLMWRRTKGVGPFRTVAEVKVS